MPPQTAPVQFHDLLGRPFKRGARGPDAFDCYGLIIELYRRQGIELPDFESPGDLEEIEEIVTREAAARWRKVPMRTIGSVVTLRVAGLGAHVGYIFERDRIVHATEKSGVTTDRLTGGDLHPLAAYVYE